MTHLEAWINNQRVGTFEDVDGSIKFSYAPNYQGIPVSLSMRPGTKWKTQAPRNWLDGLLPTSPALRERWARMHDTSTDLLPLLSRVGEDIAGAVSLLPPGAAPNTNEEYILLSEEDIYERLLTLSQDTTAWATSNSRMSLAGAQPKFALALSDLEQWYEPRQGAPSTHIFKPENPSFPGVAKLEAAMLLAAENAGIQATRAQVWQVDDIDVLVVRRWDRAQTDQGTTRLPAEDLCSALGWDSNRKYQFEGGPSATDIAKWLTQHADAGEDMRFVEQLAFNIAIGNADAHSKNYSVLFDEHTVQLAPLYDSVPTIKWPELDEALAMPIGGGQHIKSVTQDRWLGFASRANLDADLVLQKITQIYEPLPQLLFEAMSQYLVDDMTIDYIAMRCSQATQKISYTPPDIHPIAAAPTNEPPSMQL